MFTDATSNSTGEAPSDVHRSSRCDLAGLHRAYPGSLKRDDDELIQPGPMIEQSSLKVRDAHVDWCIAETEQDRITPAMGWRSRKTRSPKSLSLVNMIH